MAYLALLAHNDLEVEQGDFGVIVDENVLWLPPRLEKFLKRIGAFDAEEFVKMVRLHPICFMAYFDWSREQYECALKGLIEWLEGHVKEEVLRPPPDEET